MVSEQEPSNAPVNLAGHVEKINALFLLIIGLASVVYLLKGSEMEDATLKPEPGAPTALETAVNHPELLLYTVAISLVAVGVVLVARRYRSGVND